MFASLLSAFTIGLLFVPGDSAPAQDTIAHLPVSPIGGEEIAIAGHLSASGVLIADIASGERLYERQASVQRPMASLAKLMTALIIVENHDLAEFVTVPRGVAATEGMKAYLPEGEQFTVGDLLSALLIASANDAAETLAIYHSGSIEAFTGAMNARARVLGLRQTSFADPVGFDHPRQWTTPQDLAWLATFVLRFEPVRARMGRRGASIFSRSSIRIDLTHTHALLHADTDVVAGKTGTTDGAGECLLSVVARGGKEYLVVLLRSQQRYGDMAAILEALAPEGEQELVTLAR